KWLDVDQVLVSVKHQPPDPPAPVIRREKVLLILRWILHSGVKTPRYHRIPNSVIVDIQPRRCRCLRHSLALDKDLILRSRIRPLKTRPAEIHPSPPIDLFPRVPPHIANIRSAAGGMKREAKGIP